MTAGPAPEYAREMEEALEAYRRATAELLDAVERLDDAAADEAVSARALCIERYARVVAAWRSLPAGERDDSLLAGTNWHRLRINEEDAAVLDRICAIRQEIGAEITRLGQARKADRAYQAPAADKLRIVNGEG